jgi:polyphosphate glucokinase
MSDGEATAVVGGDIGGTGIKGALADLVTGEQVSNRMRLDTPHPVTEDSVARTVKTLLHQIGADGPAGITLPAVIRMGVVRTAPTDESWMGLMP